MDWGVFINYTKQDRKGESVYRIDVLLAVDKSFDASNEIILPPSSSEKGEMKIVSLRLSNITRISAARIYVPKNLSTHDGRQSVMKSIQEIKKRFNGSIPLLDPLEDMKIKDKAFLNIVKRLEANENKLKEFEKIDPSTVSKYENKSKILKKKEEIRSKMKKIQSLLQMNELKCRKRVLRRLGFCTSTDVIKIKGRVACEITR